MSFAGKTFHLEVAEENSEGECISCTRISHYLRLQITHLNPARPSELPLLLLVQSENSRGPLNVEVDNEQDFVHRWWHICLGRVCTSFVLCPTPPLFQPRVRRPNNRIRIFSGGHSYASSVPTRCMCAQSKQHLFQVNYVWPVSSKTQNKGNAMATVLLLNFLLERLGMGCI